MALSSHDKCLYILLYEPKKANEPFRNFLRPSDIIDNKHPFVYRTCTREIIHGTASILKRKAAAAAVRTEDMNLRRLDPLDLRRLAAYSRGGGSRGPINEVADMDVWHANAIADRVERLEA